MRGIMLKYAVRSVSFSFQENDWQAGPHQSFIWNNVDYRCVICSLYRSYSIVSVIPKEGLMGALPVNPPFGMTTTKSDCVKYGPHV